MTDKIKAIVWDLDGTLIHFKIDFMKARKLAIHILKENGAPETVLSTNKTILENVNAAKKVFHTLNYDDSRVKNITKQIDEEISKVEYEAALQATPVNGIEEVLKFAKQKNVKQAIYTYNSTKNAVFSIKKVELEKYFDAVVGRDEVNNPKPHPEHLFEICKRLGVTPSEVLVIGDTLRDIEGAQNISAPSIAIHTKLFDINTLKQADYIVEESEIPLKLIDIIDRFL